MKSLVCDFDDVICNNKILDLFNEYLGSNYTFEDVAEGYDISKLIPDKERQKDIIKYVVDKNFYKGATLKKDAYKVLKTLKYKYNYEIYICSACLTVGFEEFSGKVYQDKFNFLTKKLPFVNPRNIIFTNSKGVVQGDVMIDDRLVNLQGNFKHKLLFDCHYNRDYTDEQLSKKGVIRVSTWKQIFDILTQTKEN